MVCKECKDKPELWFRYHHQTTGICSKCHGTRMVWGWGDLVRLRDIYKRNYEKLLDTESPLHPHYAKREARLNKINKKILASIRRKKYKRG